MNEKITRKEFIKNVFRYSSGAAVGAVAGKALLPDKFLSRKNSFSLPWPYTPLDPEQGRIQGHDFYTQGGCGFAGFAGILVPLQQISGDPFTRIPAEMFGFAGGGVKGWGTICGALNGTAAAISLVCDTRASGQVINELLGWYTETALPTDTSNRYAVSGMYAAKRDIAELPQNTSGSPLCHVSMTSWCEFSGFPAGSLEQSERCARLSGDVVAKAIALLNAHKNGTFKAQYKTPESAAECLGCHGQKQEVGNVSTKMSCSECHKDPHHVL